MKWLSVILLSFTLAQTPGSAKRANEISLARLRPGIDALSAAEKLFPQELRISVSPAEAERTSLWWDKCSGRTVLLELDARNLIESVNVSVLLRPAEANCSSGATKALAENALASGKGLALGQPCPRAEQLYGPPNSRGPSTQGGRELNLLYYSFDWAGPDVPQVMEVTCDQKSRRIVQITLAFPSL
jgi:hypothetical protein